MHVQRTKSVAYKANFSSLSKLPEITVPKLTADNYEIFNTTFYYIIGRTIGMNVIPIDYFMRDVSRNYNYPWTNRKDKLKNCLLHTGNFSRMTTSLCTRFILSISATKVLVPILSTNTILQRMVAIETETFSYTLGMMLI